MTKKIENPRQANILDTAFKVFAQYGYKKTSMEDIAKAAHISRQGVYLYFKNKDENAQTLFAAGFAWRLELASREEFLVRMRAAIHVCCRNV